MADKQYASLGLMLIGLLATLNHILVTPEDQDDVEQAQDEAGLGVSIPTTPVAEDLGVAVSRDTFQEISKVSDSDPACTTTGSTRLDGLPKESSKARKSMELDHHDEPAAPKPPKKRRKKGDALDELFRGLI